MVLNAEFWEALTGNQRRKFAKANCEATYKKAIIYQILAAVLGMLVIGLFLPIGDKARRYFKGYYSLREEEMPVTVKILCVMDFVFGLFASLVIMITSNEEDYGLFENTLSRAKLEIMLNETDAAPSAMGVSGDPFRIANFSDPVTQKRESKPVRRGCENFDALWLIVINVVTVILFIVFYSLLPGAFSSDKPDKGGIPSAEVTSKAESTASVPTESEIGEDIQTPDASLLVEQVEMIVNTSNLNLRKEPSTVKTAIKLTNPMERNTKILVYTDTKTENKVGKQDAVWYFISYTDKDNNTFYGWACAVLGKDEYLVMPKAEVTSSVPALSNEEVKAAIISHVNAVIDVENGFASYLKTASPSEGDESSVAPRNDALVFGTDGECPTYYKATNASSPEDLNKYLSKYMITKLARDKSNLVKTVTDQSIAQEDRVIYYNNGDKSGLYVHQDAINTSFLAVDSSSISVLSTEGNTYIVTASAVYGDETVTYNITFLYENGKFLITAYK